MSKLETNTIDTLSGTADLQLGSTNNTGKVKIKGANYLVADIQDYAYNTSVTVTTESAYIDIAGGNTISFTPTSSNDIISLHGYVITRNAEAAGTGIGIMRGTSSTISSSDTVVARLGKHALYPRGSGNHFGMVYININDTGLTAGTTYYYEIYGMANDTSKTVIFQVSVADGDDRHYLSGTHYKYIGA